MLNMKAYNRTRQEVIDDYFFAHKGDNAYELISRNKFELTPLSTCYTEDGQTYKEAFPYAFSYTDEDGQVIPHDYSTLSYTYYNGRNHVTLFAETPPAFFDGETIRDKNREIDGKTRARIADLVVEAWQMPRTELSAGVRGVKLPTATVIMESDLEGWYADIEVIEETITSS